MSTAKLTAQRSQEILINRLKKGLSDTYCFADIPLIKPSTPRKNKHKNNPTEFEGIINDPILCSELRKYLEEKDSVENLNFWKAVQQFKVDARPNELRGNAKKLFNKYFRGETRELAVSHEKVENVERIIDDTEEDINISIFNSLQKEVYSLLKKHHFELFLSSSFYEEGMEIRKKVGEPKLSNEVGLTERDWSLILAGANEITVSEETTILYYAQHNHFLYRLKSGSFNIIKPINGKDTVIATLAEPGCVVGEMSVLGGSEKATATVVATKATTMFKIQVQFMFQLFETDHDLGRRFYVSFGKKLAALLDGIASFNQVDRSVHELPQNVPTKKDPKREAEKRFQILFKLPDEVLVKKFPAVLEQIFTKKGMFYISQNYICFYAIIFKQKLRVILPLKQVTSATPKLTSKGKEIVIVAGKKKYKFYFSNEEGDIAFNILNDLISVRNDIESTTIMNNNNKPETPCSDDNEDLNGEILSNEEWDVILNGNSSWNPLIRFSPGDIIFQEGSKHSIICQITSGTVRIEKKVPEDKNLAVVLGTMGPGEVFGEIQFLTDSVASASVIAQDFVDMYIIDGEFIKTTLFAARPGLVVNFYRFLCALLSKRIVHREKEGWGRKRSETK